MNNQSFHFNHDSLSCFTLLIQRNHSCPNLLKCSVILLNYSIKNPLNHLVVRVAQHCNLISVFSSSNSYYINLIMFSGCSSTPEIPLTETITERKRHRVNCLICPLIPVHWSSANHSLGRESRALRVKVM